MTKAQRKIAIALMLYDARVDAKNAEYWSSWASHQPLYSAAHLERAAECRVNSRALFAAARALRKVACDE